MEEIKWRFPSNQFGTEVGLSDSDSEMFKKDPSAGLAREAVQNSIDARLDSEKAVRVEFSCFDVSRKDVPEIDSVQEQIESAIQTWEGSNPDFMDKLHEMLDCINEKTIHCCRVSDFNTTGLLGVGTELEHKTSPWHDLIKGSGLSNKSETSGGSKGVGKNAAYVNSNFGTVFYSTLTSDGHEGHIGLAKICSADIKGGREGEKTQGIGFYGSDDKNTSIPGQLNLDRNFSRKESGTDLYILGFSNNVDWIHDVIMKLLDSFMCAILFGTLTLKVDQYEIRKDNVKEYIYNPSFIDPASTVGKAIISQYLLLTECEFPHEISLDVYGKAKLYFLDCGENYKEYFSSKYTCTMIRYPYMKICEKSITIRIPFMALCIIEDNDLNRMLRKIENPQHTAWEFNRLNSKPEEKKELNRILNYLISEITDFIKGQLLSTDDRQTEVEGAAEFIPLDDDNSKTKASGSGEQKKAKVKPTFSTKKVKVKDVDLDAQFEDPLGNGAVLASGGGKIEDLEDALIPEGHNKGNGGSVHPGKETSQSLDGGDKQDYIRSAAIRSMRYQFRCIDKKQGRFAVIFTSDVTEEYVTLELEKVDVSNETDSVSIYHASLDGNDLVVTNNHTVHLSLTQGQKLIIYLDTDQNKLFSAEVNMYAYRK